MARYESIYTDYRNIYADGAPVMIIASALLKDSQTGRMVAQVKYRSLSPKTVKALKISVDAFDSFGAQIEGVDEFQYNDLNISNREEFGANFAVRLPDANTRNFNVSVKSVVFDDGLIWNLSEGNEFKPLPEIVPIESVLNPTYLQIYMSETKAESCKFKPYRHMDLWLCTCGVYNKVHEENCYSCGAEADAVFTYLDTAILKDRYNMNLYADAISKRVLARTPEELVPVRKIFEQLGDFRDSKKELEKLDELSASLAYEITKKEYDRAEQLVTDAENETDLQKKKQMYEDALHILDAIGEFEGVKELSEKCNLLITSINCDIDRTISDKSLEKKKRMRIALCCIILTLCTAIFVTQYAIPEAKYKKAVKLMESGNEKEAAIMLGSIYEYKNSYELCMSIWNNTHVDTSISAASHHTVGLNVDGTVIAVGHNGYGRCAVTEWKDIVEISAGSDNTIGLKTDGTVDVVGDYHTYSEHSTSGWKNVISVSAGCSHAVGLKFDGTVVAVGNNDYGQCIVSDWNDIIAVSAGYYHTVGLKSDGTVIAVGNNDYGQCDISTLSDIIAVSAGYNHTVGLRSDGTVVAVGDNSYNKCNVTEWEDVVAISASSGRTVGLKTNGTVVAVGNNDSGQCNVSDWNNIVSISAGYYHTVGLKSDGTVVAVGKNNYGQCDVSGWTDIKTN